MNQATVDRALRALSEINIAPLAPLEEIPPMASGVTLVGWEPKPAPVLLTRIAVVNDVSQYIRVCLAKLDAALRLPHGPKKHREVREMMDRLEQCGVVVRVRSHDSINRWN